MKKTGTKAFVCSFVFSLFMLLGIDKVFLRDHSTLKNEIKIPSKNIVLFINNRTAPKDIKPLPVKKIALNILPEIKKNIPQEAPQQAAVVQGDLENEIIMASEDFDTIPLDLAKEPVEKIQDMKEMAIAAASPPVIDAPKLPEAVYIPEQDRDAKNLIQPGDMWEEPQELILTDDSEALQVKDKTPGLIAAALADTNAADNAISTPAEIKDTPNLLIPLEKSGGKYFAGKGEINIVKKSAANQVALADKAVPIKSMTTRLEDAPEDEQEQIEEDREWNSMPAKRSAEGVDSPWVVAKGSKHPKNSLALQDPAAQKDEQEVKKLLNAGRTEKASGEIQVAADMINNILIPIPQEILDEEQLTPQLVSSDKSKQPEKAPENEPKILDAQGKDIKRNGNKSILNSITSIFGKSDGDKSSPVNEAEKAEHSNKIFDGMSGKLTGADGTSRILPTEIRLSFQPGRAEISGSTLSWVRAFAKKAVDDATAALEIRIDGTSDRELQQKRLNLLYNILTNKGVEYSKIKVVFTAREPNSFIIRTIKINEEVNGNIEKNKPSSKDGYYLQW